MNVLTKKAVLVALHVGGWNARKRDKEAAAVVHQHYRASPDSGNYNKALIDVNDPSWREIIKARTALREYHYAHTLPWAHHGLAILPTAMYLEYRTAITSLCEQYLDAARAFVDVHYERLKREARIKRNGLYREEEYPSASELRSRYYAEARFLPVPDKGHVIADLSAQEIERVRATTAQTVAEAVERAQAELWARLYEPIRHMAETLADPERRFHDTLVSNIRQIVAIAPKLTLVEDRGLAEMIAAAEKLSRVSPNTLRHDPDKRAEAARKAEELARKMAAFVQP